MTPGQEKRLSLLVTSLKGCYFQVDHYFRGAITFGEPLFTGAETFGTFEKKRFRLSPKHFVFVVICCVAIPFLTLMKYHSLENCSIFKKMYLMLDSCRL